MDDGGAPHHKFGPLLIGLIGVAAGAIIVATYQCLVNNCCCSQRRIQNANTQQQQQPNELPQGHQELQINPNIRGPRSTSTTTSNNSPALDQLIPVFKYSNECKDGICAVCLCDFKDGEAIRVLPECMHLFHVGCIDKWLNSHSNCPLCRTGIVPPQRHVVLSMPNLSGVNLLPAQQHVLTI